MKYMDWLVGFAVISLLVMLIFPIAAHFIRNDDVRILKELAAKNCKIIAYDPGQGGFAARSELTTYQCPNGRIIWRTSHGWKANTNFPD